MRLNLDLGIIKDFHLREVFRQIQQAFTKINVWECDKFILSQADVDNHYLILKSEPSINSEFVIHNGMILTEGSDNDYVLVGREVRFSTLREISIGDGVTVKYTQ